MKSVLLYLFLVGIPVLGIVGILHLGETLTPPISVGGVWNVEISSQTEAEPGCDNLFMPSEQPILLISQSGPHLLLAFNTQPKTTMQGKLQGVTITAQAASKETITADNETAEPYLEAGVDQEAEPDRLEGSLSFSQCALEPVMHFTALRQQEGG